MPGASKAGLSGPARAGARGGGAPGGRTGTRAVPEGVIGDDNLVVLRALPDCCLDLVYLDPPFGTGQVRRLDSIRTGSGERTRQGFGGRSYSFRVVSSYGYRDNMGLDEYLGFLYERLVEVHRALAATGSLYLHLDFHAVHYARVLLDEIFGPERFLNEVIWAYDYGGRARDRWPRKHDNILWYAKSGKWTFNSDAVDRIPYMAPGLVGPEKAARGKLPTDTWWMTIVPTAGKERTGYPTQKPLKLLERIIAASSNPGDLVADFFCGSGTTGVAAARLGRRYLLVDANPDAVSLAQRRLAGLEGGPAKGA
ncbi:MAG TPA: site-specific DNA-methyltransferase [Acidimicrobiales bacterium]|nr:site-specific DNA-methyltransferase [Acidimicrobiales bacterium]